VSFEALLRWTHPERGPISPATFIPLAEESGLIEAISRWVTEQACTQLAAWHAQFPQHAHVGVHVNASSKDLGSPSYVRLVADLLARHDLRAARLTLEITENVLMQRVGAAADTLAQLQTLGVALSVDDFGTGYSSLSYLSTLPITSLKIDRSFVRQLQGSAENLEIVRAVINLATSLGKQVIAEGIESDAQMQRLVQLGCGHGQGFHLAEPLSVRQATALLASLEPPADPAAADRSEPRLVAAGGGAPRLQLVH
jgi:EAL domain-containing protein (putative c-di-GMP-specific phosphodiesterase class I)